MAKEQKQNVKSIRAGLNLTQSQMAEKLGLGLSSYRSRELGIKEFTYGSITMILKLSGLQYDEVQFKP